MTFKKFFFYLFILLFFISIPAFCRGNKEEKIASETNLANIRVVSLAPGITEIIFALGKGKSLVGRTNYCNYPLEATNVVSIGEMTDPNIEKIIELKPDIVIAATHAQKDVARKIESFGIEFKYMYNENTFESVYSVIKNIGLLLDAEKQANNIIDNMEIRFEKVKKSTAKMLNKPSVYYVVGFGEGGEWTAGGDTFIGQILTEAGGNNIASEISGWSFSLEKLIEADPEIILISRFMYESFIKSPVYSELSAVKEKKVYKINEDIINRQGPRLIEGVELLNDIFSRK